MNFGSKLRSFRNIYNITQDEIADAMGIERSTYSYYETGRTPPTMEHAKIISKIFFVPLDYLLENTVLAENESEHSAKTILKKTGEDPIVKILNERASDPNANDAVLSTRSGSSPTMLLVSDRIEDELKGNKKTVVKYNDEVFELNRLEKEVLVKVRLMEAIYRNKCHEELSEQTKDPFALYNEAVLRNQEMIESQNAKNFTFLDLLKKQQSDDCSDEPLFEQCDEFDDSDIRFQSPRNPIRMSADDFLRLIGEDGEK